MRIAVSGLGVVAATGVGVAQTRENLLHGRSGVGALTLFESNHRVPVGEVKHSNEELKTRLGIEPHRLVSRTTLLGMTAVREALDDAGVQSGFRVGLVSATSVGGMDLTEQFFPHFMADPHRGRIAMTAQHDPMQSTEMIARHCGIDGYRTTISTACSSAANALIHAARLIRHGVCDVVVAGGCDALSKFTLNGFSSLGILSAEPCRPFDRNRTGLNLGEGAGYVVLQREDTCSRTPYCFLTGYANANDAHHQTATSDEGEGAFRAMSEALQMWISTGEWGYGKWVCYDVGAILWGEKSFDGELTSEKTIPADSLFRKNELPKLLQYRSLKHRLCARNVDSLAILNPSNWESYSAAGDFYRASDRGKALDAYRKALRLPMTDGDREVLRRKIEELEND